MAFAIVVVFVFVFVFVIAINRAFGAICSIVLNYQENDDEEEEQQQQQEYKCAIFDDWLHYLNNHFRCKYTVKLTQL